MSTDRVVRYRLSVQRLSEYTNLYFCRLTVSPHGSLKAGPAQTGNIQANRWRSTTLVTQASLFTPLLHAVATDVPYRCDLRHASSLSRWMRCQPPIPITLSHVQLDLIRRRLDDETAEVARA